MAGPSGLFGSGLSGLLAARTGLATAGHNIANVDTPGYTRQRVDLVSREAAGGGIGFVGAGVQVAGIRRIYDQFLTGELRTSTSNLRELELYRDLSAEIDNLLGDANGGLAPAIQRFFGALHDLADDPASVPSRQVVLSEADALVRRFQTLDLRLEQQRQAIDGRLRQLIGEINSYAEGIATLNRRVVTAEAGAGGEANDLRDQRDELIRKLAERIGISVFAQDDGSLNVTTGTGQVLVVGATSATLGLRPDPFDPARQEVVFTTAGGASGFISEVLSGGELAGLLAFRREVLDGAENALGRVALALSHAVNARHRLGTDLDGNRGGDLLTDLDGSAARIFSHQDNSGSATLAVRLLDVSALTTSDYRLERQGSSYLLTRLSDGAQTTLAGFPATPAVVDGLELSLAAGSIADGDRFLIQPTRAAGAAIGVEADSVRQLAAALPVRAGAALTNIGDVAVQNLRVNAPEGRIELTFTTPSTFDVLDAASGATLASGVSFSTASSYQFNGVSFTLSGAPAAGDTFAIERGVATSGAANGGTGAVASVTVNGAGDPSLADPVTITFDDPPGTFSVSGATTGSPSSAIPYTSGAPISFNGWTLELVGTPAAGDTITVGPNTAGVGDNRNALALADLQVGALLDGGAATFEEANGQEITRIGVLARQSEINAEAQQAVHDQITQARESVSGVNLDEEAAELLRYQRAYQAAAQMLATANQVFETLLRAMSR